MHFSWITSWHDHNFNYRSFEDMRNDLFPNFDDVSVYRFKTELYPRYHFIRLANPERISITVMDRSFGMICTPDGVELVFQGYRSSTGYGHLSNLIAWYSPAPLFRYDSHDYRIADRRFRRPGQCPRVFDSMRINWDGTVENIDKAGNFFQDCVQWSKKTRRLVNRYINWWEFGFRNQLFGLETAFVNGSEMSSREAGQLLYSEYDTPSTTAMIAHKTARSLIKREWYGLESLNSGADRHGVRMWRSESPNISEISPRYYLKNERKTTLNELDYIRNVLKRDIYESIGMCCRLSNYYDSQNQRIVGLSSLVQQLLESEIHYTIPTLDEGRERL